MISFKKVFRVFKNHYEEVPLEIFKKDSYKTLVSTTLSSRTKDEVTLDASKRLFEKAPDFNKLSKLSEKEIRDLIYPVGFYKTKAKYLKQMSKKIFEDFNEEIPKTRKELMKLPGVGRKTANLVLNRAFDKPAIAVDTHVHKISNMLGWVKTKTPKETEEKLAELVPQDYWPDLNRLFVSIGRQHTTKESLGSFLKEKGLIPQEE